MKIIRNWRIGRTSSPSPTRQRLTPLLSADTVEIDRTWLELPTTLALLTRTCTFELAHILPYFTKLSCEISDSLEIYKKTTSTNWSLRKMLRCDKIESWYCLKDGKSFRNRMTHMRLNKSIYQYLNRAFKI